MKAFLVVISIVISAQVQAASLFKNPKEWVKDVDDSYREDRKRIIREGGDIATLGSSQRERDRDKANAAKAEAERQKANAEKQKTTALENKTTSLVELKNQKKQIQQIITNMNLVETGMTSSLKLVQALVEEAKVDKASIAQILGVVVSQQDDLAQNLKSVKSKDRATLDFVKKVSLYREQLVHFPVETASEEDLNNLTVDLSEQCFEVMAIVRQIKTSLTEKLKSIDTKVFEIKKEIQTLTK